jgi:hypothetical protein
MDADCVLRKARSEAEEITDDVKVAFDHDWHWVCSPEWTVGKIRRKHPGTTTASGPEVWNALWTSATWSVQLLFPLKYSSLRQIISRKHNMQSNKCTLLVSDILCCNILLINATCFDPSWGHDEGFISKHHFTQLNQQCTYTVAGYKKSISQDVDDFVVYWILVYCLCRLRACVRV